MYVNVATLCFLAFAGVQQTYGFAIGNEVEEVEEIKTPLPISLQYGIKYNHKHKCGGTILNSKWVLTAASCIINKSFLRGDDFYVVAGIFHKMAHGQQVKVDKIIVHPDYINSLTEGKGIDSDIALLKLEEELKLETIVGGPVTLPKQNATPSGNSTLSGWATSILQSIELPVLSQKECKKALLPFKGYEESLKECNVCTGQNKDGEGACFGDEAGYPLVAEDGNTQIGIASWGPQGYCKFVGAPALYTRVSAFVDWINGYINCDVE